jgi:hypothetical protein
VHLVIQGLQAAACPGKSAEKLVTINHVIEGKIFFSFGVGRLSPLCVVLRLSVWQHGNTVLLLSSNKFGDPREAQFRGNKFDAAQ